MLIECHTDTWFSTQGLDGLEVSMVGAIPGDPLGDIVYAFLASKVHGEVEQRCIKVEVLTLLPSLSASNHWPR